MVFRLNDGSRNIAANALASGKTVLELYTGTQPATAGTAASGTLLATFTGLTWAAGATGVQAVEGEPETTADASGTVGWGRFRDVGDTERFDGAVGAEFTVADPEIIQGGLVRLTAAQITQPAE